MNMDYCDIKYGITQYQWSHAERWEIPSSPGEATVPLEMLHGVSLVRLVSSRVGVLSLWKVTGDFELSEILVSQFDPLFLAVKLWNIFIFCLNIERNLFPPSLQIITSIEVQNMYSTVDCLMLLDTQQGTVIFWTLLST